jgi:hypothetical protein
MPEQNQPIQGNFGGIFNAATPNLDRVTQQLQQQYADRKAFLQKETEQSDEVLNKEMAGVRSIDTPDVIDAYNQYKSSRQNQLFNKSLQQNPKLYAQAQMDANAKYANVLSMINKSKQLNDFGKQITTNRFQKPDVYADDAGDLLSTFYQTPMSKLTGADYKGKKVDLTNLDNWRYAAGNVDLTKTYSTAAGKPVTHYDDGTTDESGIQTTQHGYQYGNTPLQFRNTALTGLAGSQASRRARYDWAQHSASQQDLDQLDAAYQNSPNWQKLGLQPQPLPPYNPNDPIGNEATYQAKQYLVSMNPAEVKAATTVNQGAKMTKQADLRLHGQEVMEAIKEGNREKLAGIKHQYKQMDVKEQSQVLDDTINGMMDDATKSGTYEYKSADGKVSKQYEIKASPELKLAFPTVDAKGHKYPADALRFDPANKTVIPIYYKRDENGKIVEDNNTRPVTEESKPVTFGEFKAIVGKTFFGTREAAKENPSGKKVISGW